MLGAAEYTALAQPGEVVQPGRYSGVNRAAGALPISRERGVPASASAIPVDALPECFGVRLGLPKGITVHMSRLRRSRGLRFASYVADGGSYGTLDFEPVEAVRARVLGYRSLCGVRCFEPDASLLLTLFVVVQLVEYVLLTVGGALQSDEAQIRGHLGFRECSVADADKLTSWLAEHVACKERRQEQVRVELLARRRAECIEPPTPGRCDRIVGGALRVAEEMLTARISARLAVESTERTPRD
ncbi:hypothetical protein ACFV03_25760 [Streptomyces mirabilis]|uniref:hypothetical protein n=1 Tax=Streptomyces mirabilis TaxID=68239 RepID=UPI0036AE5129